MQVVPAQPYGRDACGTTDDVQAAAPEDGRRATAASQRCDRPAPSMWQEPEAQRPCSTMQGSPAISCTRSSTEELAISQDGSVMQWRSALTAALPSSRGFRPLRDANVSAGMTKPSSCLALLAVRSSFLSDVCCGEATLIRRKRVDLLRNDSAGHGWFPPTSKGFESYSSTTSSPQERLLRTRWRLCFIAARRLSMLLSSRERRLRLKSWPRRHGDPKRPRVDVYNRTAGGLPWMFRSQDAMSMCPTRCRMR